MLNQKNDSIRPVLKKMIPRMAVLNLFVFLVTLFWGFDYTMLFGLCIGYLFSIAGLYYLGSTINSAVVHSVTKAKTMMIRCYVIRYACLVILCYLAAKLDFINFVGVLLPQFYPRIVLSIMTYFEKER